MCYSCIVSRAALWERYIKLCGTFLNYCYYFFRDEEIHIMKKYANASGPGKNMSKLLDKVLNNYDRRIRPFYGGESEEKLDS